MLNTRGLPRRKVYEYITCVVLTVVIIWSTVWIARQLNDRETNAYAYTFSFGKGYGFTVYTHLFDKLDPLLQESVRIHESVHLENGTIYCSEARSELAAYDAQIKWLQKQAEEYRLVYNKTHKLYYLDKLVLLKCFEQDVKETREYYAERVK